TVIFLCYLPAIHGDWLFDEVDAIVKNPLITEPGRLGDIWLSTQQVDYWPVSYTAFWLQWRLWGDQTTGYHLVSLLLHAGVSLLVWRVLHRLQVTGAWIIALLFAAHPVNVETAAWIFQQKTSLAALGFFGSLAAWLEFRQTNDRRWYAAAVAL